MRRTIGLPGLAALLAAVLAPSASAQVVPTDRYLDHDALTRSVEALAGAYAELASVESLARTAEGRDVWLLTLGRGTPDELDRRPALLVVANLEANHVVGSSTALLTAEHLLTGYGADEEITRLLDERTVYVIPRVNPDGAERVWSMPAYELPYKPHPAAPDQGGLNAREIGRDLNGDGIVTLMRVPDPDGAYMIDPDEPRLLRRADRTRAERGAYSVYVEGIELDQVEAYIPMGSDGVNLNRNFPHEYLYYRPHVGPHQVSEPETRALADFMFEQVNVASVLTFSPYDNLRSPPPASRTAPEGVAPGPPSIPSNVLPEDRAFHDYISERFREVTSLDGDGLGEEAGSFGQFAYYQVGIPSFTTPVWAVTGNGAPAAPNTAPTGASGVQGDWAISLTVEGQPMDAGLSVVTDGGALRATLDSPAGAIELEGRSDGNRLQASGEVPQMGTISVTGEVSGQTMTGSVALGPMGTVPFTGTRTGGRSAAASPAAGARRTGDTPEHRWLAFLDAQGVEGFVDWEEAEHPTLGTVEVGGFVPNARVNPPVGMIEELARPHAEFAVWLGHQLPELEIVETTVEPRGDGVFMVSATIRNDRYLPTHFQMGTRVRTNRPITARLAPTPGVTVLTGDIQQQIPRLEGMGARHTFQWLVQAPAGTSVDLELFAERAGGLQSTPLTLR